MTLPEINLCYTNCERFGPSIYEEFIKDGKVKVSIYGCLGRCNLECKDSPYVEVLSPLMKILADENSSELVKKIKEYLNLE
ncbi:MAG: DUF1450 domain-containing protein [archaeon]|nr:DUF1450 domain-containing protein [archaeon]